jgi:hypothetical protein
MTAAAAPSSSDDRNGDLLEELEQILKQLDSLSSAAQEAVGSVAHALLREGDLAAAEIAHLTVLLTYLSPRGHARPAVGSHRGSERGTTRGIAIALSSNR